MELLGGGEDDDDEEHTIRMCVHAPVPLPFRRPSALLGSGSRRQVRSCRQAQKVPPAIDAVSSQVDLVLYPFTLDRFQAD